MTDDRPHSKLIERILSGARVATLLRIAAQIISWAGTLIVVRYVSPEDYGLNAMLEAPLVLFMVVSTLGLETALVQAKNLDVELLRSTFGFLIILDGMLFLGYFFGGPLIATYFNEPRLDALAKVLAFLFLTIPFRVVPSALLDRQLDFKLRAQVELVCSVAAVLITLGFAYHGAGVWALIIGVIASRTLQTFILMVVCPWFIAPRFSLHRAWEMVSFGSIVTLSSALGLLSDQLAGLIGGRFLGAEVLGFFALGAQFAALPLAKGMPILNQTMLPAFVKFQSDPQAASYYLEKVLGIASLAFFPALLGMAAVADTLVTTVFGTKWSDAILPLAAMSIAMLFRLTTQLIRTTVLAMGRADLTAYSGTLQLAMMLPLTVIGVEFGISGLVVAFFLAEVIVALGTLRLARQVLDIAFTRVMAAYAPALLASLFMVVAVLFVRYYLDGASGWWLLAAEVLAGAITFVIVVRLMFAKAFKAATSVLFGP